MKFLIRRVGTRVLTEARWRPKELGLILFMLGAWLAARPYDGIWHDSILYTAQALKVLNPSTFSRDLFFFYGSQDQYTIFPILHAYAIEAFGVYPAAKILTIFGKFLWFLCLVAFYSSFLSGAAFWAALAIATSYSPFFDGHEVFSYGEQFLTSRLYAEAFVMGSLALFLRNRMLAGAIGILIAALLHPLIALIAPVLIGIMVLFRSEQKAGILLLFFIFAGLIMVLAACGISPFEQLLKTYDSAWLTVVKNRNPYVFIGEWSVEGISRVVMLAVVLLLTFMTVERGKGGALALAALGALSLLLFATWLGSDVLNNVLLTQLQLWRALWLIQLVAWAGLGHVIISMAKGGDNQKMLVILLVSALLLAGAGSGPLAILALLLYLWIERYHQNWKASVIAKTIVLFVLVVSLLVNILMMELSFRIWDGPSWHMLFFNMLSVIFIVGVLLINFRKKIATLIFPVGVSVFFVGAASFIGDKPSHNATDLAAVEELQRVIPPTATVFKPGGLAYNWFYLQRANYASGLQAAGVLFSRETAIESSRRLDLLWSAGFHDGNPYWPGMEEWSTVLSQLPDELPAREVIEHLCHDDKLDYLILPRLGLHEQVFMYTASYEDKHLRLYDCALFRTGLDLKKST